MPAGMGHASLALVIMLTLGYSQASHTMPHRCGAAPSYSRPVCDWGGEPAPPAALARARLPSAPSYGTPATCDGGQQTGSLIGLMHEVKLHTTSPNDVPATFHY